MSSETESPQARYCVGIDLGTTNCAVAFVDMEDAELTVHDFPILQWVDWGNSATLPTLPSFHYQPTEAERAGASLQLPFQENAADDIVGTLARDTGAAHPGRRIASAKSWLCHDGIDRTAAVLPWHAEEDVERLSPVDASARYLAHIREAWNARFPNAPLEEQDVVITLPASFDEVARELTVTAAKTAGLPRVYLIEEPQAAFYSWLARHRESWENLVKSGELILVCDIGGGTSDFTLIRVRPVGEGEAGTVQFHRVAVGEHLILGGDNLDLALAKFAEQKLDEQLSPRRWEHLLSASRRVKETMLSASPPEQLTVNLPSEGSRLIAGAKTVSIDRKEAASVLIDGFFPTVKIDDLPQRGQSGFQEFGLPFAHDPAITRHLASFLNRHRTSGLGDDETGAARPGLVLFNGGVMAAEALRNRVLDSIADWFSKPEEEWRPAALDHDRLDLAVARGAAYYGIVRRGQGVRIAANLGRSYYIQVSQSPPRAMCLIPGKAQPGETYVDKEATLEMSIGQPVQFPIFYSSTRLTDDPGQLVDIESGELSSLPPICTALTRGKKKKAEKTTVRLEAELTEIGTLGLYCAEVSGRSRWQLQFDIRSTLETDRTAHSGEGETMGVVDQQTTEAAQQTLVDVFGPNGRATPAGLVKKLQRTLDLPRREWPPSLLRTMVEQLIQLNSGRQKSPAHEERWLNLIGYCLRPGYGVAVDDWRVSEVWRRVHNALVHRSAGSRTESLILWRRIAGGLTAGQQRQLADPLLAALSRGGRNALAPHEQAEVWRLLGSLELLPVTVKKELGERALKTLAAAKLAKAHDAATWSIGRLGARIPAYGPLNCVVSPSTAGEWLESIKQLSPPPPAARLAVLQLARLSGDRWRDLDEPTRQAAADWLAQHDASAHFATLCLEGGKLDQDEEDAVFGEALPLGLHLVR